MPAAQVPDLEPRKWPSQRRSRETFEALVEAATGILAERGYAGATTNHIAERAGVNIASLYEYFPGKDALVAQVADRLVRRVLARLAEDAARAGEAGEAEAVRRWLRAVLETVGRERELIAVLLYQVPYVQQLEPLRALREELLAFSRRLRDEAGGFVAPGFNEATLHLTINLVTSTVMQLLQEPPRDVEPEALFEELVVRVEEWIRGPERAAPVGPPPPGKGEPSA